jgi:hypothetical protein
MNEAFKFPNGVLVEIDDEQEHVATYFPDGHYTPAVANGSTEDIARARSLGYAGTDEEVVWKMTRDHDVLHSAIANAIDEGFSKALHGGEGGLIEERLVFLLQRALNVTSVAELLDEFMVSKYPR